MQLVTKPINTPLAQTSAACSFCAGNGYIMVKSESGLVQAKCSHCSSQKNDLVTK